MGVGVANDGSFVVQRETRALTKEKHEEEGKQRWRREGRNERWGEKGGARDVNRTDADAVCGTDNNDDLVFYFFRRC